LPAKTWASVPPSAPEEALGEGGWAEVDYGMLPEDVVSLRIS